MMHHEEVVVYILREMTGDETKGKRKVSYLVAKALGVKTNEGEGFAAKLFLVVST